MLDLTPDVGTGLQLCFKDTEQILAFEGDLLQVASIQAMCSLSTTVVHSHYLYPYICHLSTDYKCLPVISLGNVLASLKGKSSCQNITAGDVSDLRGRLAQCAQSYLDGYLKSDCGERKGLSNACSQVPPVCTDMNAMYTIMNYLIDKDFVEAIASQCQFKPDSCVDHFPSLRYSISFLQAIDSSSDFEVIYKDKLTSTVEKDGVSLVGFHFNGVAFKVFQERLLSDIVYPSLSIIIVFIIVWIYTRMLFVTALAIFAILSSMGIAYFLYTIVFGIDFFPFINLTAIVILIGVGSDDVFVYVDTWKQNKTSHPHASLEERVHRTLRHAALSMFVTSFTTSTAFFATSISTIVSIKCFGVYAGTSVLVNYVLMITWLPAVVVISDKYIDPLWERVTKERFSSLEKIRIVWNVCLEKLSLLYTFVIPWIVSRVHIFLILSFVGLSIGMSVVVFHSPSLQLPTTSEFQLFLSSDILSTYDFKLAQHFDFQRSSAGDSTLSIAFAFGPIPKDHGSSFAPAGDNPTGPVSFHQSPMVISEEGQLWLIKFCSDVRNATFYQQGNENCFISAMEVWLQQLKETGNCDDYKATIQRYAQSYQLDNIQAICCDVILPTNATTFDTCLLHWSVSTHIYPYDASWYGPRFQIDTSAKQIQLIAILAAVQSNRFYSNSYADMNSFYETVQNWLDSISKSAPPELQGGWFTSPYSLKFYDLQKSLSIGSVQSMGVSIALAFVVLFLTTLNLVISIYAIVSIAGTLVTTIGTLVLIGWQLNILESIAMSIAVGLSVDFAVHYGVAYRLCPEPLRVDRTRYAIKHMGPAITMAALTTFIAGGMMMPSRILAYFQLGTFLMLIMFYSWLFANFFFLPVCYLLGPQRNFAQIKLPKSLDCYSIEGIERHSTSDGDADHESTDNLCDRQAMSELLLLETEENKEEA